MTATELAGFAGLYEASAAARATEPRWLRELRDGAFSSLNELGLPTARDEDWRFTPLKPVTSQAWVLPGKADVSSAEIAPFLFGVAGPLLVLVDGRFEPRLSRLGGLPAGVRVEPLSAVIAGDPAAHEHVGRYADHHSRAFLALNAALFADGALVRLEPGARLAEPLHVLHVSTGGGALCCPRLTIELGEQAELSLLESYAGVGAGARLVNAVTEQVLARGAQLRHIRLLRETEQGVFLGWQEVRIERDAMLASHSLALGAHFARAETSAMLRGEGASCDLKGLVLARGRQHMDHQLLVDHVRPRCTSRQLYRSVVDERARSVFAGRIVVRPGAIGTDASQQNNNLLLSDDARVDTKPQLEIYADDVKCSHGATSGRLDPAALFFLRSRGLDVPSARSLLTYAFANDVVESAPVPQVRAALEQLVRAHFAGVLGE
ncbi:MAG: Fe-S cluster assembly protein SufD [Planctomycetes bacterium]|nr:Fe-S cluster assembly protein SufD [Planctomycetota bacterium]